MEDRVSEAHSLKQAKYEGLLEQAALNGWSPELFTIEVGSRGYVAPSLKAFLRALDIPQTQCKSTIARCSAAALRCSYIIYLSRDVPEWTQGDNRMDTPAGVVA